VHFVPQQRFLRSNEKKNENTDIHSNPSMMERESKRKKEKKRDMQEDMKRNSGYCWHSAASKELRE